MIDCDVHNIVSSIATLEPYLDAHWREVVATSQFAGPTDKAHPPNLATSLRPDLAPVADQPPGATLESVQAQLLDPLGISHAILDAATTGSRASATPMRQPRSRLRSTTGRSRRGSIASHACGPRSSFRAVSPNWRGVRLERASDTPASSPSTCRSAPPCPTATEAGGRCSKRHRREDWRWSFTSAAPPGCRRPHRGGPPRGSRSTSTWPPHTSRS